MVRDICAGDRDLVVLSEAADQALDRRANPSNAVSTAPAEIGETKLEEIVDVAALNSQRAIHVGFAECEVRIRHNARNDGRIDDADCQRRRALSDEIAASVRPDDGQLRMICLSKPRSKNMPPPVPIVLIAPRDLCRLLPG